MDRMARKALANMANNNQNKVVGYLTAGSSNRYAAAVDEYQGQKDGVVVSNDNPFKLPF